VNYVAVLCEYYYSTHPGRFGIAEYNPKENELQAPSYTEWRDGRDDNHRPTKEVKLIKKTK